MINLRSLNKLIHSFDEGSDVSDFLPFITNCEDLTVISTAALHYAIFSGIEEEPMKGPRLITELIKNKSTTSLSRVGMFMALLSFADKRCIEYLHESWDCLDLNEQVQSLKQTALMGNLTELRFIMTLLMSEPPKKVERAVKKYYKAFIAGLVIPAVVDFKRIIPVSSIREDGLELIGFFKIFDLEDSEDLFGDIESSKYYRKADSIFEVMSDLSNINSDETEKSENSEFEYNFDIRAFTNIGSIDEATIENPLILRWKDCYLSFDGSSFVFTDGLNNVEKKIDKYDLSFEITKEMITPSNLDKSINFSVGTSRRELCLLHYCLRKLKFSFYKPEQMEDLLNLPSFKNAIDLLLAELDKEKVRDIDWNVLAEAIIDDRYLYYNINYKMLNDHDCTIRFTVFDEKLKLNKLTRLINADNISISLKWVDGEYVTQFSDEVIYDTLTNHFKNGKSILKLEEHKNIVLKELKYEFWKRSRF